MGMLYKYARNDRSPEPCIKRLIHPCRFLPVFAPCRRRIDPPWLWLLSKCIGVAHAKIGGTPRDLEPRLQHGGKNADPECRGARGGDHSGRFHERGAADVSCASLNAKRVVATDNHGDPTMGDVGEFLNYLTGFALTA